MAAKAISRFDIYRANLDPTIGHEIQKTRPVLVVSPDELNRHLATVLAAPLTTTIRPYPFRPTVVANGVQGQVALDQMRALDKARLCGFMAVLGTAAQENVLRLLAEMFSR
ncbi:type II toxin-antitoxin system PemK/MazF family toxin [uncultured Desulfovibrio sp.]|uniref:type II toxin-antitoxin system PemK/MazF family toxin n=1 Tax=uncultured Desulfovibrio sp. TaxID=167968 RepID=UPI00261457A5|nr:type II toxin-antitoxin system PemK/MazF family toxin [uncultured Desulfovibrio sp.]